MLRLNVFVFHYTSFVLALQLRYRLVVVFPCVYRTKIAVHVVRG